MVEVITYHYKRLKFYDKIMIFWSGFFYFPIRRAITAYVGKIWLSQPALYQAQLAPSLDEFRILVCADIQDSGSTQPGVDSIVLVTFEKNVINMKCADCFFKKSMISAARGPLYQLTSTDIECFFLSQYTARPSFEYYRQVYFVHSGLQDESLQVTISKLP